MRPLLFLLVILITSCQFSEVRELRDEADRLNESAYNERYKNLEELRQLADKAYDYAERSKYNAGKSEALCHKAFYAISLMHYDEADSLLATSMELAQDNISKLCVEVAQMRLCQRRSLNKEFYLHKFQSERLINLIHNNQRPLTHRQRKRYTYGRSEYGIILSAYLYYVGMKDESAKAILDVSADTDIFLQQDTAQWLSYLYNVGYGDVFTDSDKERLQMKEFDCLMQCFMLSSHLGYLYWEGNSLQALSDHLSTKEQIDVIRRFDKAALEYINPEHVPDSLLSNHLAERSLSVFTRYGNTYQTATAWRTLADDYFEMGEYNTALNCLAGALADTLVYQAPILVSSVDERLSLAYSALDDKQSSDYYRNAYLDIQDSTRQDRQLEARADALRSRVHFVQAIIFAVLIVFLVMCATVYVLVRQRRRNGLGNRVANLTNRIEELNDEERMLRLQLSDARRLNVVQHARINLVQTMQPLIDRMDNAARHADDDEQSREYLAELCDSVSHGNELLTQWIQLSKGDVKLKVETFPLQDLFNVISLSESSFSSKGVTLSVEPTPVQLKADRMLTLFLINTLVDNARKFTAEGNKVSVSCRESEVEGYADISIADTGTGMTQQQADHLFEYHVIEDGQEDLTNQKSHGFGLMNCRGIIDRYKKTSNLFAKAAIQAVSKVGEGTTITFRLPVAVRMVITLIICMLTTFGYADTKKVYNEEHLVKANAYCDSMYYCNIEGRYADCMAFADSSCHYMNLHYLHEIADKPDSLFSRKDTLSMRAGSSELRWFDNGFDIDYDIILAVRNEAAVAALALHDWDAYGYNNRLYRTLYHRCSADKSLDDYCRDMENYALLADLALIILGLLIVGIIYIFYRYYVRDIVIARKAYQAKIAELEEQTARLRLEFNRLYVANSIADNCLSTIKHETMYYPSRISHLIKTDGGAQLTELVTYYRTLYSLLSSHCQRLINDTPLPVEKVALAEIPLVAEIAKDSAELANVSLLCNRELLNYIFVILKRKNKGAVEASGCELTEDGHYLRLEVSCPGITMLDIQLAELFHITTCDPDYLVVKQIIREFGDRTNRYASGVRARKEDGVVNFILTLPIA